MATSCLFSFVPQYDSPWNDKTLYGESGSEVDLEGQDEITQTQLRGQLLPNPPKSNLDGIC